MKCRMLMRFIAGINLLAKLAAPSPPAAQQYRVINLGEPLGGTASAAQGINNRGWVEGDSSFTGNATEHAVLWRDGKIIDLGTMLGTLSAMVALFPTASAAMNRLHSWRLRAIHSTAAVNLLLPAMRRHSSAKSRESCSRIARVSSGVCAGRSGVL